MARILRGGGGNAAVRYFGIRPEQDHLILRGNGQEASSVLLRGVLVLCTTEPLKVQDISLRFSGEARSAFSYMTAASSMRQIKQEDEFLRKQWQFDVPNLNPKQTNVVPPGNHEFPFDMILPGDLPESIEGYLSSWVIYRLKAVIDRGLFARNLEARHHIRLIRTFDPSSLELSQNVSISNTWPNKISYSISAPSKGIAFGSAVTIDFQLVPMLKGLRITRIRSTILETIEVLVELKGEGTRTQQISKDVAEDEYDLPEDTETQDVEGSEGYLLSRTLQLPRSLQKCMQSVNEKNIFIKHQLRFNVGLLNPDGHLSELRANLPISIFISPNMRLNDRNEIDASIANNVPVFDATGDAPPGYGDHHFDALYTEVDPRSYITPGQSQPQSRRGSSEDEDGQDDEAERELSANTLRNRLANLQGIGQSQSTLESTSSPPNGNNTEQTRTSVRIQGEGDQQLEQEDSALHLSAVDSQHIEFNTEAMSRVPSYNTALHTATRTPITTDLPHYSMATNDNSP